MTLTVPCLFGLESLVAEEMRRLELKNVRAENGRVNKLSRAKRGGCPFVFRPFPMNHNHGNFFTFYRFRCWEWIRALNPCPLI